MISSELPEVLLMSDRILVIKLGKISSSFINSENLTQEEVLKAASPS